MKKKKVLDVKEEYRATLKVLGKTYEATGASVSEAISNLEPGNGRGRMILTLQHGEKKKERVLMSHMGFRLFSGPRMTKEIALKQTSALFDV